MDDSKRPCVPAKRILLVDDDAQILFVLSASLRRLSEPCAVTTAQDGSEAYHLLDTTPFDLLVTDIRLPGLDGVTLTALAKARWPELPVVWMTAHGCRGVQSEVIRLHVYRCLEKPVEVAEFRQIVRQAMCEIASATAGESAGRSTDLQQESGRRT